MNLLDPLDLSSLDVAPKRGVRQLVTMPEGLTASQAKAFEAVQGGGNVLITGPGGTGKSYLLEQIIERNPEIGVTATTGVAANNIGGVTIHSWAGLGLGKDSAGHCARRMSREARERILRVPALIVDEVSMMGPELLDLLDEVLRIVRGDFGDSAPFGGVQMIFTGDFLQLPPVSKGRVKYAFEADAWQDIQTCELVEIVRQSDPIFAGLLNAVRVADPSHDYGPLVDRVGRKCNETDVIRLHTHNDAVDRINLNQLGMLPGEALSFPSVDGGNERLVKDSRLPARLDLKIGARVMHLTNAWPLFNGQMGEVVDFGEPNESGRRPIVVRFGGEDFNILPITREVKQGTETLEVKETPDGKFVDSNGRPVNPDDVEDGKVTRPKVVASRTQYPLRLAYAVTVHKSQGMTLERVRVNLARSFAPGQVYTALSRCKSLEGLYIDALGDIQASDKAVSFYREGAGV